MQFRAGPPTFLLAVVWLPFNDEEDEEEEAVEEELAFKTSFGTISCHPVEALGELPATSFPVVLDIGLGDMRRAGDVLDEAEEEEVFEATATAVKTTATKPAITMPIFPCVPRLPS